MKTSLTIDVNVKVDLTENSVNLLRSLFAAAMPTGCCNAAPMPTAPVAIEGVAAVEEARAIDKAKAAEEAKAKMPSKKESAKPVEEAKAAETPAAPVESQTKIDVEDVCKALAASVESQPKIDIEDVRKALVEKVNDHRDAIKQKLTELGASSVTKLDPAKYAEMYNFLKALS